MGEQHELRIETIFRALGLTGRLTGHELVHEGLSGSRTYRVWFDGQDAVLKVTDPDAEPHVRERAQRELSFYQVLANQVPLRVPELLGSCDDDIVGLCLLTQRYVASPPPAARPLDDAIDVAHQLAGLHAAYWDRQEALRAYPWLRDLRTPADAEAIVQAHEAWRTLARSERFSALFGPDIHRLLDSGLARVPALNALIHAFPPTLCHGDCHLGNVLRDVHGHLLWADWAEVGVGAGPSDLSFLIQRANAAGAHLSVDRLSAAYHNQLTQAIDPPISLSATRRVMDAFELRTQLLEWPHYMSGATPEALSRILERIEHLIAAS